MTWKFLNPEQIKNERIKKEKLRKFRITKNELERFKNLICNILLPAICPPLDELKPLPDELIPFDRKDYFDLKLNQYLGEDEPDKTFRELLDESGWQIVTVENKGFLLQPKEPI